MDKLKGTEWSVIPDHLDIGAYIAAAALTGGEITVKAAIPGHMSYIIQSFEKVGVKAEVKGNDIYIGPHQKLECETTVRGDIYEIFAMPWPGLPVDFMQIMIVTALKAKGSMILHNSFQEYGMFWIEELVKLKAKVVMADPYRVLTFGPTDFKGSKIFAPNIIQATMALFLAALSAKGETVLEDRSDSLLRRYPDLVEVYTSLGAKIERVKV